MLKFGLAWFYLSKNFGKDNLEIYKSTFIGAREEKRGLFAKETAQDPKDFRKTKQRKRKTSGKQKKAG